VLSRTCGQHRLANRPMASGMKGPIDWNEDRDIYEPLLGPMVQQQLADRPELLAKLSD
jgi:hypothetical protein